MKRICLVLAIAIAAATALPAQSWGRGISQSVTVTGTLQLQNGFIAVVNGNTAYLVPGLERYVGFIDGLKEGASVTVEGYASGDYLQASKLTLNGKSYNFLANNNQGWGRGGNGPMRGGFGGGGGGCGWCF